MRRSSVSSPPASGSALPLPQNKHTTPLKRCFSEFLCMAVSYLRRKIECSAFSRDADDTPLPDNNHKYMPPYNNVDLCLQAIRQILRPQTRKSDLAACHSALIVAAESTYAPH